MWRAGKASWACVCPPAIVHSGTTSAQQALRLAKIPRLPWKPSAGGGLQVPRRQRRGVLRLLYGMLRMAYGGASLVWMWVPQANSEVLSARLPANKIETLMLNPFKRGGPKLRERPCMQCADQGPCPRIVRCSDAQCVMRGRTIWSKAARPMEPGPTL